MLTPIKVESKTSLCSSMSVTWRTFGVVVDRDYFYPKLLSFDEDHKRLLVVGCQWWYDVVSTRLLQQLARLRVG